MGAARGDAVGGDEGAAAGDIVAVIPVVPIAMPQLWTLGKLDMYPGTLTTS